MCRVPGLPLRELLRKAYFVPGSVAAGNLFRDMQTKKVHMAIVVDEYGNLSGLITLEDLLEEIQKQLKKRQWGEVIRLEVEEKVDKRLLKILKRELSVGNDDIYEINGPLDLTFLMKMYGMNGFDELKTPSYTPQPVPAFMNDDDIFTNIRKGDILLHHPYQTFEPVVEFVRQAAKDPDVLAIKQTLYRVSGHSPIVAALAEAAERGKQVSVLVPPAPEPPP